MNTDPDNVRVDLLRVKRKLYISYPEGSKERKEFVLASKLSELSHLQHLVTPDMVDMVFDEYMKATKGELFQILLSYCSGCCFSVMFFGFHQLNPHSVWFSFWMVPAIAGFINGSRHVYHLLQNWQRLQPFKKEYASIQERIQKVMGEIKGLAQ
jgi:hypothetical protein